jgi:hypothetical protein
VGPRAKSALGVLATVGAALLARDAPAQTLFTFQPPHVVRRGAAQLDAAFGRRVDRDAAAAKLAAPEDLVAFALRETAAALHFGLGHRTRLAFDGADREGNCVEYAELFAAIVERERGPLDVRVWIVRSDARVLGSAVPDPAWKDHDWVLVAARARAPEGPRRLYVDPTLDDMGLGWDLAPAVRGAVRLPE